MEDKQVDPIGESAVGSIESAVDSIVESAVDSNREETPMGFHEESHECQVESREESNAESPVQPMEAEETSPDTNKAPEKPEETKRHASNRCGANKVENSVSSFRRTVVLTSIVAERIR